MNTPASTIVLALLIIAWDAFCLYDLARAGRVRYLPKWAWAIICLIAFPWGGIAYVIFGKNR